MIFGRSIVTDTATGWIVFVCVFGGAVVGMLLRRVLPANHLKDESKDVVKLGMGLLATMTAGGSAKAEPTLRMPSPQTAAAMPT